MEKHFLCVNPTINGAEQRLLSSMKRGIQPTLQPVVNHLHKPSDSLEAFDFASLYLNRDWYLMIMDYINDRIQDEVFELQPVWLLQCYYGTTATNLFQGAMDWFTPARRLHISYERYSFLLGKLGADQPRITVRAVLDDAAQDTVAEEIWGSFHQHNNIVSKLEKSCWVNWQSLLDRAFV